MHNYCNCIITRCADTGSGPSALGVIVKAAGSLEGFLTVSIDVATDVEIVDIPTIWLVSVPLPTTVYGNFSSFYVSTNCPASVTLTWNIIKYVPISDSENESLLVLEIVAELLGPSWWKSTLVSGAMVEELSGGIKA